MKIILSLTIAIGVLSLGGCGFAQSPEALITLNDASKTPVDSIDWASLLDPEAYRVLRQCGTEPPFTGKYWDHHEDGIYACAGCNALLFDSETKFESGSGWPSFFDVMEDSNIRTEEDRQYGMNRLELLCAQCGGHLGHVFDDGPPPHGLRYCINSVSLQFAEREK